MGERVEKLRKIVLERIKDNVKKNWIIIGFIIWAVVMAIWNLSNLLFTGVIDPVAFWALVVDLINLPVVITIQIVLNGKYRVLSNEKQIDQANHDNEIKQLQALNEVKTELCLLKQENEHLKIVQQLQNTVSDLNEQIHKIEQNYIKQLGYEREISKYSLQLAARDENIRNAICSNKDWSDNNDLIRIIEAEKNKKETVEDNEEDS